LKWREQRDLVRKIEQLGCVFIRHAGNHDWYQNPTTKVSQPVPRHRESKEYLAKHILKMLANK
jgi:predicted RNA binding protein YcfA (HicA-like mRNA interferase family)